MAWQHGRGGGDSQAAARASRPCHGVCAVATGDGALTLPSESRTFDSPREKPNGCSAADWAYHAKVWYVKLLRVRIAGCCLGGRRPRRPARPRRLNLGRACRDQATAPPGCSGPAPVSAHRPPGRRAAFCWSSDALTYYSQDPSQERRLLGLEAGDWIIMAAGIALSAVIALVL